MVSGPLADSGIVLGAQNVADAEGENLSAVPAVKHPGGGFVDDFGESVGVGGKLGVSLVDREVVRIEEFVSETEPVGGLGRGDDGLGDTVGAAGFENVIG